MMNQQMIFNEERQTWNLIVDNEWYAEGTYEQMMQMWENNLQCEAEEDDAYYDYD